MRFFVGTDRQGLVFVPTEDRGNEGDAELLSVGRYYRESSRCCSLLELRCENSGYVFPLWIVGVKRIKGILGQGWQGP